MAHALTKLVNCGAGASRTCRCEACRKISEGVFADLLVVEPRGAAGQITLAGWKPGRDDPDGLQYYRFVDSRPIEGARKVLVIRDAGRMNVALGNFLLKLIEEPPSYLLIVLLTQRPGDLLVTIRSRCAPVKFNPLSTDEMRGFAAGKGGKLESGELDALIGISEGRPGRLLELIQGTPHGEQATVASEMLFFQEHGFPALFRVASNLASLSGARRGGASAADGFESVLNALLGWFRDALLVKTVTPELVDRMLVNRALAPQLSEFARQATADGLSAALEHVCEAYAYAPRQTDKAYVLETVLLRIGRAMRG